MLLNLLVQTNPEWRLPWPFLQPVPLADISGEQPSIFPSGTQMGGIFWLLCPSWTRTPLYPLGSLGALLPHCPSSTHESCPADAS